MAKVILIGLPGDTAVWMVDLDQKSVIQLPEDLARQVAQEGRPIIRGVDYAVAVDQQSPIASGKFDTVEMPFPK
ncbi:hypothetical protein [Gellertiella hungarica]|uniref:Uncharacterized protein n=1 Tax=Gellertiella hungarica TaxID=1572859 RepID=A0A7W6J6Y0_9HYPH|nr:hypothetical protein [Gellertiella hungarica]MBB4065028.1 hypothetical protein [Gellertiella hungarica]